jgi:hypothetical protein
MLQSAARYEGLDGFAFAIAQLALRLAVVSPSEPRFLDVFIPADRREERKLLYSAGCAWS